MPKNKMMKCQFEPLINPTWEQSIAQEPLLKFSFYLSGRVNVLYEIGEEIITNLEKGFSDSIVNHSYVARAETLMWLWILGAYEIVRTMDQAKVCFSDSVTVELTNLKKYLAKVRIPAAKMEKPGNKIPVPSNRSASGWDESRRDLIINDPTESVSIFARDVLDKFDSFFSSIKPENILDCHENAYKKKA